MLTRRENLHLAIGLAASFVITQDSAFGLKSVAQAAEPPFKLPPLGYGYDALEPTIDTLTMTIHHDRHHGAYVAALNKVAEQYPDLATKPPAEWLSDLSRVPEAFRTPVRNNLGGHWNHSFFWDLMTPGGAKGPQGNLKAAIDQAFGSEAKLIEAVDAAGLARFGSGWWSTGMANSPLSRHPIRIRHSKRVRGEWCSASMCGNTPIISNIRTGEPIILPLGGMW